jgi:hypothetical protein
MDDIRTGKGVSLSSRPKSRPISIDIPLSLVFQSMQDTAVTAVLLKIIKDVAFLTGIRPQNNRATSLSESAWKPVRGKSA